MTLVTGSLVSRIHGSNIVDPSGLGRWSGVTLCGSNAQKLTIITGYIVCSGSIKTAPLGSAFAREYNHFQQLQPNQTINLRRSFIRDLEEVILELQAYEHAVILMLDANATFSSDPHFSDFIETCSFHDMHSTDPVSSTYIGAPQCRIDFFLGCPKSLQFLYRSGTLVAYNEGPQSDHRGLYVDLRTNMFTRPKASIEPTAARGVHTGNPELVTRFNEKMMTYYEQHRMVEWIDELFETYQGMSHSDIRAALTSWDNDKNRAMQHAERSLTRPSKKCKRSPAL